MKVLSAITLAVVFLAQIATGQNPNFSPYRCVANHINNLTPVEYNPAQAAKSFYTGGDTAKAMNLAIKLKKVFDGKGLYIVLNKIPDDPDYLDSI